MIPSPIEYHIYTGELPQAFPYAYVLAGNGLFKVANTPHFRAAICMFWSRVSGLAPYPEMGLILRAPKIPAECLYMVYAHARRAGSEGNEQMYHFHWWQNSVWKVALPRQQAHPGYVDYSGGDESSVVLDLHSHHRLAANFSAIDNSDEQGCRFYVVIGRLFTRPEIRVRLGVYGDFISIPAATLFEGLGPFMEAL
jgi:PRTRC genetic system protein A